MGTWVIGHLLLDALSQGSVNAFLIQPSPCTHAHTLKEEYVHTHTHSRRHVRTREYTLALHEKLIQVGVYMHTRAHTYAHMRVGDHRLVWMVFHFPLAMKARGNGWMELEDACWCLLLLFLSLPLLLSLSLIISLPLLLAKISLKPLSLVIFILFCLSKSRTNKAK